ncbi:hypothetical protein [Streptomyces sp. CMB-StM0423]|uniref:hypothetical protein n=1 Tax=Streptomyces sp. CMB-StM0423 TaxID=2059884 RepID=UPI001F1EFE67|nr:hypothetical protein [Streptomyces sp. CMB-StM0423]
MLSLDGGSSSSGSSSLNQSLTVSTTPPAPGVEPAAKAGCGNSVTKKAAATADETNRPSRALIQHPFTPFPRA